MGAFFVSILSVGIDFACEATFPLPANNVSGVMWAYSYFICTILVVVASFIMGEYKDNQKNISERKFEAVTVSVMFVGVIVVGLVCSVFTREDLRKTKLDQLRTDVAI